MKKKIILTILIIALASTMLAGCALFQKNEDRVRTQAVYTINHKGQTAYITQAEYERYLNRIGINYLYMNKNDPDKAIAKLNETLIKRKIMLLEAKNAFKGDKASDTSIWDILSNDERDYAIKLVNKQFEDVFEAELNILIAEIDAQNKKDKTEDITFDDKKERGKTQLDDSIKYIKNEKMKDTEVEKTWVEKYKKSEHTEDMLPKYKGNDRYKEAYRDAYKNTFNKFDKPYDKKINKKYKNDEKSAKYYSVLEQYLENILMDKYKNKLEAENKTKITEEEIQKKYEYIINEKSSSYKDKDAKSLASDFEKIVKEGNLTPVIPGLTTEDGATKVNVIGVKSILFKFSESQIADLKSIEQKYGKDSDKYSEARKQIAMSYDAPYELDGIKYNSGIYIYKSNLNYDSKQPKSVYNAPYEGMLNGNKFEYKKYKVDEILDEISKDLDDVESIVVSKYPNDTPEQKEAHIIAEKRQVFLKWINLVNDDPGMFDKKNNNYYGYGPQVQKADVYTVKVSDTDYDKKYVREYSVLANEIYKNNKTKINGVSSVPSKIVDIDGVKVEIVTRGNISYIINDFGVQFMMVFNSMPNTDGQKGYDNNGNKTSNLADIKYYKLDRKIELAEYGYKDYDQYLIEYISKGQANLDETKIQEDVYDKNKENKGVIKLNKKLLESITKPFKEKYGKK